MRIEAVLDAISKGRKQGYSSFGIRSSLIDYVIGDRLKNSFHEGGNDGIEGELDGTCCFDASQPEIALKQATSYADGVGHLYLIAGHSKNCGVLAHDTEDLDGEIYPAGTPWGMPEGENAICIPNACVIAKLS